jgi:spore germination cell wall hydrolase CwlJ-like protein
MRRSKRIYLTLVFALIFHSLSGNAFGLKHKEYTKDQYVHAILGEARGSGYEGMLDIACAIRNRAKHYYYKNDPLNGVYGLAAEFTVSKEIYNIAVKAWGDSLKLDSVNGAYIWGNKDDIKKFRKSKWFKNVKFVLERKGHFFYKDK